MPLKPVKVRFYAIPVLGHVEVKCFEYESVGNLSTVDF